MSTLDAPVGLATGEQVLSVFTSPSSLSFTRQQRLLLPREYKAVFDGNTLKASHPSLLLLVRVVDAAAPARLGLVIAKKHVRLAVQRNRIKRQLRESFRSHQHALMGLDIVALARPGLGKLDNA
ncbi:MAG TPA: ribonuclease P protein component, partial [Pseudomonadales bacterium]|nr:ribonuclease P protein component [Pseudomonadales bacterium]